MRVEVVNGEVRVTLSRRNLRALLAKLDGHPPGSYASLRSPNFYSPSVLVTAEEDEVHYAHESREGNGPGWLHPDTEAAMEREGT